MRAVGAIHGRNEHGKTVITNQRRISERGDLEDKCPEVLSTILRCDDEVEDGIAQKELRSSETIETEGGVGFKKLRIEFRLKRFELSDERLEGRLQM